MLGRMGRVLGWVVLYWNILKKSDGPLYLKEKRKRKTRPIVSCSATLAWATNLINAAYIPLSLKKKMQPIESITTRKDLVARVRVLPALLL